MSAAGRHLHLQFADRGQLYGERAVAHPAATREFERSTISPRYVELTQGQHQTDIDFGYAPPPTLSCVAATPGQSGPRTARAWWRRAAGALHLLDHSAVCPGLTLNASTGAITGTPTTAGPFAFTAKVVDARTAPPARRRAQQLRHHDRAGPAGALVRRGDHGSGRGRVQLEPGGDGRRWCRPTPTRFSPGVCRPG